MLIWKILIWIAKGRNIVGVELDHEFENEKLRLFFFWFFSQVLTILKKHF